MKTTQLKILFLLLTIRVILVSGSDPAVKAYTSNLPFTMPEIQTPDIPATRVSIAECGAVADGMTMNTGAIETAIQQCVSKGGGVVVVPPGLWLTGPIRLQSKIDLHLDSGAVVVFSKRFEDYPMFARPKSSLKCIPMIYGRNLENVAITGKGMFEGNGQFWRPVKKEKMTDRQWKQLLASGGAVTSDGKIWWPSKEAMSGDEYLKNLRKTTKKPTAEAVAGAREFLRPVMVAIDDSKRVLIDGPTFANAPGWTLVPARCEDVVMRNLSVNNPWWGQNTDAIDIHSSRNVLLYNAVVSGGDDGICVKPARENESRPGEPGCENIVVADCTVYSGHGGFVIGSESNGGARNISVRNCTFVGTDIGLRFKSAKDRGGVIEKVFVDGIRMKDIANDAILFDMVYEGNLDNDPSKISLPQFRDFSIRNIVCDGATTPIFIRGLAEMPVKNIRLENISINSQKGCFIQDAEGIEITRFRSSFTAGPAFTVNNASGLTLTEVMIPQNTELFIKAAGKKTENVVVSKSETAKAKRDVETDPDVPKNAITIH